MTPSTQDCIQRTQTSPHPCVCEHAGLYKIRPTRIDAEMKDVDTNIQSAPESRNHRQTVTVPMGSARAGPVQDPGTWGAPPRSRARTRYQPLGFPATIARPGGLQPADTHHRH